MDTPALRYTAQLFGIRNIALGVQVWQARGNPTRLRELAGSTLTRSPELKRPALAVMTTSLAVASGFLGLRAVASG